MPRRQQPDVGDVANLVRPLPRHLAKTCARNRLHAPGNAPEQLISMFAPRFFAEYFAVFRAQNSHRRLPQLCEFSH
jgi:hypothetical protein